MRKNFSAGIPGNLMLHSCLEIARSVPGRKARWTISTRGLQWMKRLSSKRVRRACEEEITEVLQDVPVVVAKAAPAAVQPGIPVIVKGKGRREIAREERAFTSPSIRSLFRFEDAIDLNRFLEQKALARMQ